MAEKRGKKVNIRSIRMEDTPLIVQWRNNPEVRSQFVFQKTFTPEIHENWMKTKVAAGEVHQFIIETTESGQPIGSVYLRDVDLVNRSAEYGIFIGSVDSMGKGYGTEAAKLLLDYAFQDLKLHRVFLRVFADNQRAINSYLKVGFQQEGVAKDMIFQNGKFRSMVFMAIVQE